MSHRQHASLGGSEFHIYTCNCHFQNLLYVKKKMVGRRNIVQTVNDSVVDFEFIHNTTSNILMIQLGYEINRVE